MSLRSHIMLAHNIHNSGDQFKHVREQQDRFKKEDSDIEPGISDILEGDIAEQKQDEVRLPKRRRDIRHIQGHKSVHDSHFLLNAFMRCHTV